jgi:4-hydroxybenzoate polyprenyltransferase
MASSAIYLCNDIGDVSEDRKHPAKRFRAIASGKLRIRDAKIAAVILLVFSAGIAYWMHSGFTIVLGFYLITAGLYSIFFKKLIVLDVVVLAILYGLRVWAGAEATSTFVSNWLIGFCLFLFLSLALVKRMTEVAHTGRSRRYTSEPLSSLASASAFSALVMLSLYIRSDDVIALYGHPDLLWAAVLILAYWLMRVILVSKHHDPLVFALTDWPSWICASLITGVVLCSL